MEYYILFEEHLKKLNKLSVPDPLAVGTSIAGLCKYLRISKVTAYFYDSLKDEAMGNGRSTCVYDTGVESVVAISDRIVTEINSVGVCEIAIAKGDKPWDYTERAHHSRHEDDYGFPQPPQAQAGHSYAHLL